MSLRVIRLFVLIVCFCHSFTILSATNVEWNGTWLVQSCTESCCCPPPMSTIFIQENGEQEFSPISYLGSIQMDMITNLSDCQRAFFTAPWNLEIPSNITEHIQEKTYNTGAKATNIQGLTTVELETWTSQPNSECLLEMTQLSDSSALANCWANQKFCLALLSYLCKFPPCQCQYYEDGRIWCLDTQIEELDSSETFQISDQSWLVVNSCEEDCCCPLLSTNITLLYQNGITSIENAEWNSNCNMFTQNQFTPIFYNISEITSPEIIILNNGQVISTIKGNSEILLTIANGECNMTLVQSNPTANDSNFYIWIYFLSPIVSTLISLWILYDINLKDVAVQPIILNIIRLVTLGDLLVSNCVLDIINVWITPSDVFCNVFYIVPSIGIWIALYWTTALPYLIYKGYQGLSRKEERAIFSRAKLFGIVFLFIPLIRLWPNSYIKISSNQVICEIVGSRLIYLLYNIAPLVFAVPLSCYFYGKLAIAHQSKGNVKLRNLIWYPLFQLVAYSPSMFQIVYNYFVEVPPSYSLILDIITARLSDFPSLFNGALYLILIRRKKKTLVLHEETDPEEERLMYNNTKNLKEALIL